jgi:hypothetical protein
MGTEMKRTLLCFALLSVAGACLGQTPQPIVLDAIPSWVKLDRAVFAEDRVAESDERTQLATLTRELNAHPKASPDLYPGHSSRFGPVEAYRYDERPVTPQVPKSTDTPPPASLNRPSIEAAGWKVSMPNVRTHSARLLLQRTF